jgi:hypothetical protein
MRTLCISPRMAYWPPRRPDGAYHILVGDRPQRRTLPAGDDVLTALQELGCKQPFEVWVCERVATRR